MSCPYPAVPVAVAVSVFLGSAQGAAGVGSVRSLLWFHLAHVALAACTALVPWPSASLLTAYRSSIVPLGAFSCVH